MTISRCLLLFATVGCLSSASAEVLNANKVGFTLAHERTIQASRD